MYAYRAEPTVTRRWHSAYTTLRSLREDAVDAFNTRNQASLGGAWLIDESIHGPALAGHDQPDGCRPYPGDQSWAPACARPVWLPDRRTRLGRAYAAQIAGLPESLDGISIHRILGPMGNMPGQGRTETTAGSTIHLLDRIMLDGRRYDLWDGPVPGLDPQVWEPITNTDFEEARCEHDFRDRRSLIGLHITLLERRPVAEQSRDLHRHLTAAARAAHAGVRTPGQLRGLEAAMAGASELLDEQYYPGLDHARVRPRVQEEIQALHQLAA